MVHGKIIRASGAYIPMINNAITYYTKSGTTIHYQILPQKLLAQAVVSSQLTTFSNSYSNCITERFSNKTNIVVLLFYLLFCSLILYITILIFIHQPKHILMNPIPNRIVIYTQDVSNMTGLSDKASRKLLRLVRQHYGKSKGSFVTIDEFATYTGIRQEIIHPFLI